MGGLMLIDLFLDIGIVFFVLCALVPLLDVLLNDAQKEQFSKRVHHVWYWLDERSQKSYWLALQRAKRWILLTGVGLACLYVLWANVYGQRGTTNAGVFEFYVLSGLCLLLGWWCVSFTLRASTLFKGVLRGLLVTVLPVLPAVILTIIATKFISELTPQGAQVSLFQALWVIGWIVSVLFGALLIIFLMALVLPLVVSVFLSSFLVGSEFIVRRVAEYPKGAVLAVGAFGTAILAIVRVLR